LWRATPSESSSRPNHSPTSSGTQDYLSTPTRSRSPSCWDKSLEDSADLEDPDTIAEEIADDLQAALEQFAAIAADLRERD